MLAPESVSSILKALVKRPIAIVLRAGTGSRSPQAKKKNKTPFQNNPLHEANEISANVYQRSATTLNRWREVIENRSASPTQWWRKSFSSSAELARTWQTNGLKLERPQIPRVYAFSVIFLGSSRLRWQWPLKHKKGVEGFINHHYSLHQTRTGCKHLVGMPSWQYTGKGAILQLDRGTSSMENGSLQ